MAPLFAPAWQDLPCIYCNSPVGCDGETDDGEYYVCSNCLEAINAEYRRVSQTYFCYHTTDISELVNSNAR